MHYKNGREAKNGDKVIMPGYGAPATGPRPFRIQRSKHPDFNQSAAEAAFNCGLAAGGESPTHS